MAARMLVTGIALGVTLCCGEVYGQASSTDSDSGIVHGPTSAVLTVDTPRPLNAAADVLTADYGLCINYEDAPFVSSDLVDVTAAEWKKNHPGAPHEMGPAGKRLQVTYPEDASLVTSSNEQQSMLTTIVQQYNGSAAGEPGKFVVYKEKSGCWSIVGLKSGASSPSDSLAGTLLSETVAVPAGNTSLLDALSQVDREMAVASGAKVIEGIVPLNLLVQTRANLNGQGNEQAHEIIDALLKESPVPLEWRVLYDANVNTYALNIVIVRRSTIVGQ